MANYIMQIFRAYAMVVFSWGFNAPTAIANDLRFKVQGFKFKGAVEVVYNEGTDLFDVKLKKNGKVVAGFLQRSPKQGWASKAKPIPTITKGLPTRQQKQNQHKHRQVVADFLQRNPKHGWASEAKPITTQKKEKSSPPLLQMSLKISLVRFGYIANGVN